MNIVASDINPDTARETAEAATGIGGEAISVVTEVRDLAANAALLDAAVDAFGRAHVVCLNAGVAGTPGRLWTISDDDWDWTIGINLRGVMNGIRTFVPHLVELGDGHVVTTASIAGHISSPYGGLYNAGKHAVVSLSETLYHELRSDGVDVGVTCLCPGFVDTNIITNARSLADGEAGTPKDDRGERWLDISERALSAGLDPDTVGNQVHDAILSNQFWLFTDHQWDQPIATRVEEIVAREAPTIGLPTRP